VSIEHAAYIIWLKGSKCKREVLKFSLRAAIGRFESLFCESSRIKMFVSVQF
jgi:hypothetical protein